MTRRDHAPPLFPPRVGHLRPERVEGMGPDVGVPERGRELDFRSLGETRMRVGETWGGASGSWRL